MDVFNTIIDQNYYFWVTEEPLSTTSDTMMDFIDNDFTDVEDDFELDYQGGSYAEIIDKESGDKYKIDASGDGDFCSHKVLFTKI